MVTRRKILTLFGGMPVVALFGSCAAGRKGRSRQTGGRPWTFLFCNDLHVSSDAEEAWFAECIGNWKGFSHLYDFVVVGGDLVNDGREEELVRVKRRLDRLGKPFYTVIGNHDNTVASDNEKDAYRTVFGENRENYIIMHKDTALLFCDLSDGTRATVGVREETVERVRTLLSTVPETVPLLVFSHFPLHPEAPGYAVVDADRLFERFDTRKVLAYLSGHYHGRWRRARNGVPHIGNACLSLRRDNDDGSPGEGYLLVTVFESHVEERFYMRGTSPVG